MTSAIPPREPIGDLFSGSIIQLGDKQAIATSVDSEVAIVATGSFVIRYGLRFLGKLHISIVPGIVVMDYGDMITGETAWDFLQKNSNLYPRSEVVGYRNDGTDDMLFVRTLDMAVPPEVLVYADDQATKPLAKPVALIAADITGIPQRILEYLPHYLSLAEWQAEIKP